MAQSQRSRPLIYLWSTLHQLAGPWSLRELLLRMLEENAGQTVRLRAWRRGGVDGGRTDPLVKAV
ncbi:hypothetical protein EYF80_060284 [Liparis tanakae]|uniref:Uncharacterized protein n=1 Tax=Liparis tanakae TaxID=230148 RepID=A0A4Z2EL03_9TELE|nr:hypothetical protein EYF80_060284 [Liparis tanakae]